VLHLGEEGIGDFPSPIRPEWVTEELKKHFFKKPEYDNILRESSSRMFFANLG
jgi:hypothetical protein